jgi:hypothetical protein
VNESTHAHSHLHTLQLWRARALAYVFKNTSFDRFFSTLIMLIRRKNSTNDIYNIIAIKLKTITHGYPSNYLVIIIKLLLYVLLLLLFNCYYVAELSTEAVRFRTPHSREFYIMTTVKLLFSYANWKNKISIAIQR